MSYQVGIDLGTTYSSAAAAKDGRAHIVSLGNRAPVIPSVVYARDDGTLVVGEAADRRAGMEPNRAAREFKRRVGDPTPIKLGAVQLRPEALMAAMVGPILEQVVEREGERPDRLALTHPANWGPTKLQLLLGEIEAADLPEIITVSEPEAAAIHYAANERIDPGQIVAVYDLGGGTFDAALLRRTSGGTGFELIGRPEGIDRLGGIDFDAAVMAHVNRFLDGALDLVDAADPTAAAALARLRSDAVEAKEALSSDTDVTIPVLLPGRRTEVRMTRAELEAMIRPSLTDTIGALRRTMRNAGVAPADVEVVLLVGGSSRIPLVAQLVGAEVGRPVAIDVHPKHAVALGAALAASAGLPATRRAASAAPAANAAAATAGAPPAAATPAPAPVDAAPSPAPTAAPGDPVAPVVAAPAPRPAAAVPPAPAPAAPAVPSAAPVDGARRSEPAAAPSPTPASPTPASPTSASPTAVGTGSPAAAAGPGSDASRPAAPTDAPPGATGAAATVLLPRPGGGGGAPTGSGFTPPDERSNGAPAHEVAAFAPTPTGRPRRTGLIVALAAVLALVVGGVAFAARPDGGGAASGATTTTAATATSAASGTTRAATAATSATSAAPATAAPTTAAPTTAATAPPTTARSLKNVDPASLPLAPNCQQPATPYVCALAADVDLGADGKVSDDDVLVVPFRAFNFTPLIGGSGNRHIHFYFPVDQMAVDPTNAGSGGPSPGDWRLWDAPNPFGQSGGQATYAVADIRKVKATQICALVADVRHVVTPGSGNCLALPTSVTS